MRFALLAYFWFFFLVSNGVHSRSNGAPNAACGQMVPNHGVPPQNSPSPFQTSFKVNPDKRHVVLTLEPKDSSSQSKFKGFLVMAFNAASGDTATPIGTFETIDAANLLACSGKSNSAVTHKDNGAKEKVEMKWTPPEDFDGDVMFKTTFIEDISTFWVQVPSDVMPLRKVQNVTYVTQKPLTNLEYEYVVVNSGWTVAQSISAITICRILTISTALRLLA